MTGDVWLLLAWVVLIGVLISLAIVRLIVWVFDKFIVPRLVARIAKKHNVSTEAVWRAWRQ